MLLIRWIRFMRGTVTFQIEGDFAERFLNLISKTGFRFFRPAIVTGCSMPPQRQKAIIGFGPLFGQRTFVFA